MTKWRWEWKAAFSGPIVPGYLPEWVLCSWELYELKSWLLIISMPNSVLKAQSFPNPALTCSHSQLIVWADWKSNSKATFLASLFTTQQEFGTAIDTFRFSFYYSINLFNFSSIISRLAAVERRGSQSLGRHEDNMRWYAEVKEDQTLTRGNVEDGNYLIVIKIALRFRNASSNLSTSAAASNDNDDDDAVNADDVFFHSHACMLYSLSSTWE